MELQFNLDTFNACYTQVHKAKYSMNVQYLILGTFETVWAPYHIFQQFKRYCIALRKSRRNAIPSLGHTTIPFSKYPKNTFGSITCFFTREGVMHNPTKIYKDFNTLIVLHCKHHGLNYFGLSYQRGITHAQNYLIHLQYPSRDIL
jgi:hypothetical protein